MKKIFVLVFTLACTFLSFAQIKAVTENGEEVILFENGTWNFLDYELESSKEIPVNKNKFFKTKEASFLLKSNKFDVGFWLNPKLWSFSKAVNNSEAEFELLLKDEDLYGAIITEKIEIPLISLKSIALENAKSVAPDIKVVKEEIRTVNGNELLLLEMQGTAQGIKFTFHGYYYSSPEGTVQFVLYTAQNLWKDYAKTAEELLNGFVSLD